MGSIHKQKFRFPGKKHWSYKYGYYTPEFPEREPAMCSKSPADPRINLRSG